MMRRDRRQQSHGDCGSRDVRARGQDLPALRARGVGRKPGDESAQCGQDQCDRQPEERQHRLGIRVGPEQPLTGLVVPIGPDAGDIAAHAEPQHEDGDDERGGMNRIAEGVAELTYPSQLIDEPADARAEEEKVEERVAHPAAMDYPGMISRASDHLRRPRRPRASTPSRAISAPALPFCKSGHLVERRRLRGRHSEIRASRPKSRDRLPGTLPAQVHG